ncbi:hypothetical protein EYF80_007048 [Liparis tanakae]|uniref:Uncharacterized protein n=1 Tax=Liparis tanakae TaxID=230148 RepID=A0A4Z2IY47_9TELE|nr:hypothetical protein EYF80_007048 [Liparis tanakae]
MVTDSTGATSALSAYSAPSLVLEGRPAVGGPPWGDRVMSIGSSQWTKTLLRKLRRMRILRFLGKSFFPRVLSSLRLFLPGLHRGLPSCRRFCISIILEATRKSFRLAKLRSVMVATTRGSRVRTVGGKAANP